MVSMFVGITRWWLIISWAANLDSEAGVGEGGGGGRGPEADVSLLPPPPTMWDELLPTAASFALFRRKAEGRGRGGGDGGEKRVCSTLSFVSFSDDLRFDGSVGIGAIGACHIGGPVVVLPAEPVDAAIGPCGRYIDPPPPPTEGDVMVAWDMDGDFFFLTRTLTTTRWL